MLVFSWCFCLLHIQVRLDSETTLSGGWVFLFPGRGAALIKEKTIFISQRASDMSPRLGTRSVSSKRLFSHEGAEGFRHTFVPSRRISSSMCSREIETFALFYFPWCKSNLSDMMSEERFRLPENKGVWPLFVVFHWYQPLRMEVPWRKTMLWVMVKNAWVAESRCFGDSWVNRI